MGKNVFIYRIQKLVKTTAVKDLENKEHNTLEIWKIYILLTNINIVAQVNC